MDYVMRGDMEGGDDNKGPNDVWAISKFTFFLSYFFLTNKCFITHRIYKIRGEGRGGRQRRQKRAQTTHLASFGPLVSLFFFFRIF
jgi:hypothetical protein